MLIHNFKVCVRDSNGKSSGEGVCIDLRLGLEVIVCPKLHKGAHSENFHGFTIPLHLTKTLMDNEGFYSHTYLS